MTEQEQNIAVAKLLGFVNKPERYDFCGEQGVCDNWLLYNNRGEIIKNGLPNYVKDLNAVFDAESLLTDDEYTRYEDLMWSIQVERIGFAPKTIGSVMLNWPKERFRGSSASSDIRTESLLRIKGLWKE